MEEVILTGKKNLLENMLKGNGIDIFNTFIRILCHFLKKK